MIHKKLIVFSFNLSVVKGCFYCRILQLCAERFALGKFKGLS